MQAKTTNPRLLALQSLLLVFREGRSLDHAFASVLVDTGSADPRDLALCQEIANGVCRWYFALLELLKPYLRKSLKAKDIDLEIILLIGFYQILMMRIENHAAVNETVKLVQWRKKHWAKGLVNGVLRQLIRDEVNIKPEHHQASYPRWMRDTIATDWPQDQQDIFRAGNSRAPMTLRVDLRQRSRDEQIESLAAHGLVAHAHALVDSAIELESPCPVARIDGFDKGFVSVQDAATQIAAILLDCKPGMRVLDACAAPGGKTAHLLQSTDDLDLIVGLVAHAHALVDSAIELESPCPVARIDGFDKGFVSVQDAATQIAAILLDCKPGMRVLDACAAPGGKTAHLLQSTDDLDLIALDRDRSRLKMIEQNLTRVNRRAILMCGDATDPQTWHEGALFDRILADVPCSASGVVRRHPDIKVLRRADDIDRLVKQQRKILDGLWSLLKPGGLMLYSTCSIFIQENERQIEWFVEKYDNCTVNSLNSVQWGEPEPLGRQIIPGQHNMDGFYYACLQKTVIGKGQD